MFKRIHMVLLGIGAVAMVAIGPSVAEATHFCKAGFSGTCTRIAHGSMICDMFAKQLGNVAKDPKFFVCEARGNFDNDAIQLAGILECGNPGSKKNPAPGVNAFFADSLTAVTQIDTVDKNGNAHGSVTATGAGDPSLDAACAEVAPNPGWVAIDFSPCGSATSGVVSSVFQVEVRVVDINDVVVKCNRYNVELPDGLTCADLAALIQAKQTAGFYDTEDLGSCLP